MKTITLAAGTTHVPFYEVVHLIARAINPKDDDEDDNPSSYHFEVIGLETELKNAAKLGILPVKNPLTLGVWASPMGNVFNHVLVTVDDLRAFVADRGIQVVVEANAIDNAINPPPLQRTAAQDKAILQEIKKLGFKPSEIPKNKPGKPGAKASIRAGLSKNNLFVGSTVFNKAWKRMSDAGDIVIK